MYHWYKYNIKLIITYLSLNSSTRDAITEVKVPEKTKLCFNNNTYIITIY